ncbi:MAG: virulence factor [Legionella sp.]|uniref:virulence factor n=1 Tax=Legionella sp. TaxID=459 RepID=UPI0039E715F3
MADASDIEHPDYPTENSLELRKLEMEADLNDPITLVERVYQIWWHWADFHLYIVSPTIPIIHPPLIIKPELISGTHEYEFVYDIHDAGSKLSTSKAGDMLCAGMSMYKLYMTIEKMIFILVERLKSGGINTETEVQVAFGGHLLAQRKAFESIINLAYNVVVTNFDPGSWGERYLQIVKQNAERFGYPPEAPRAAFKQPHQSPGIKIK